VFVGAEDSSEIEGCDADEVYSVEWFDLSENKKMLQIAAQVVVTSLRTRNP
jgi:hypothetical protein